jgi:hypothetical protein
MKKLIATLFCILGVNVAFASPTPSERLMNRLLADHLARYICVYDFPEMKAQIQHAYDQSWFRYFNVPCRGLTCSDERYEKGLRAMFENSRGDSRAERRKVCKTYRERLEGVEEEFNPREFGLAPIRSTPKARQESSR